MEILLNRLNVEADVAAAKIHAAQLALPALGTELSGQSEALEKFESMYQEFTNTISAYLTILDADFKNINQAVCTMNKTDQEQGKKIAATGVAAGIAAGR